MTDNTLRRATHEDAILLSGRLRREDVKELRASSGSTPLEALSQGLEVSVPHAWALRDAQSGEPYLMAGVRPLPDTGFAQVWMLASPDIERHALAVQRTAKHMLLRVFKNGGYKAMANVVSADNHKAIRWLKRLGFRLVHLNQPIGRRGELFHSFAMAAPQEETPPSV